MFDVLALILSLNFILSCIVSCFVAQLVTPLDVSILNPAFIAPSIKATCSFDKYSSLTTLSLSGNLFKIPEAITSLAAPFAHAGTNFTACPSNTGAAFLSADTSIILAKVAKTSAFVIG